MFVDQPDTGLVLSGLRRYNLFTAVFFLGRQGRLLRDFVDRTGLRPGEDALDIGCGPGKLVRALGRRAGRPEPLPAPIPPRRRSHTISVGIRGIDMFGPRPRNSTFPTRHSTW